MCSLALDTPEPGCCRYVGPLPAGLRSYSAKLAASSGLTHWDLRPLGFLPLTTLALTVHSSEIRHTREFCFQVLQVRALPSPLSNLRGLQAPSE